MLDDIRFSLRSLLKRPGFTATAIAMLALGIGINAAVFTVINSAFFEGWPLVQRNDRIVQITTTKNQIYYPDFEAWRAQAKSFQGMTLPRGIFHTLSDDSGAPETCRAMEVLDGTFLMLGVQPIQGREILSSDQQPGADPVVILSYEVWARRYAANPGILGQIVRLDGVPTRIIGVMPQRFSFPYRQDLWIPLIPSAAALRRETFWANSAFARLKDGVTIEQARAEMETLGRRLESDFPATNRGVLPVVSGFEEWFIRPDARTLYRGLWGAVSFVLLIVCANVANLLVEQAMSRSHEISIRLALGAGRWRIVRQLVVESLMLSVLAGLAGLWIAKAGVRLYASSQASNAFAMSLAVDGRVLIYLMGISLGTGLLAGLATSTYLTKLNIHSTSKDASRGNTAGRHGQRLSGLFLGVEMVLAVVLLASAGVFVRSFLNVYNADVGVDPRNILVLDLYSPPERHPSPEAWISFYGGILTRLEALPGVVGASLGGIPAGGAPRFPYELADRPVVEEQSRPIVGELIAGTGYFRTVGATVISGREFNDFDRVSSLPVAIVNRQFANRNWPGEDPLGKRMRVFVPREKSAPWLTVVGVVSNILQNDRTRQAFNPLVYVPYGQHPRAIFGLVRTSVAPGTVVDAIKREIDAVAPDLPAPVFSLTEELEDAYAFERNVMVLFLVFASIALLVASVGLYAAVSNSVSRRLQEIGIRVAIGATSRDILALVSSQAAGPVGVGLAIGLGASFALNRVLKSQLVGVSPADPVALAAASAVLVLSATLGCLVPARRAMRVDPAVALRHD